MIMFDDDDGDHHRQHHIACLLFLPMATWPSSHCARYCVDTKKIQNVSSYHYFFQNESIRKNVVVVVVEVVESSSAGVAKNIYV